MATQTTSRPLCLRSRARVRFRRCASPKMAGTLAIPRKWLLPTRSIHDGGTARNSSTGETKLLLSLLASGPKNSTTGSSRKCGHSRETASLCASLTSGTTTRVTWYRSYGNENWEFNDNGLWRQGMHQSRPPHFRGRSKIPLGLRATSRRPSRIE